MTPAGVLTYLLWLLIVFAVLVYAIHVCVQDAYRRGKSPILVCALAILFFPLGTIVWLLFRPEPYEDGRPRDSFRSDGR